MIVIDFILVFFKLFYYGTIKMAKKYDLILAFYILFAIIAFIMAFADIDFFIGTITFIIILILIMGIVYYVKDVLPIKRMREFFYTGFKEIKLKTEKTLPYFLAKEKISDYVTVYSFKCYCPLKMWQAKKESLEMYIDAKIIDIKQSEDCRSIINLIVENEPIPSKISWSDDYIGESDIFNIGMGYFGAVGMDLRQHPHAFIAGETGSGKSNILKCMIHQALHKDFEVLLIDFKRGVSFAEFDSSLTVYYEYKDVITVLKDMVIETRNRLDKFRAVKVDNLKDYNGVVESDEALKKKIIFIDELAELLKTRDKETANVLNDCIETLTRLSRAVGIHLIMAIQRPDSTIVSGQIKNNVAFRVCGHFVDAEPSRIMLANDMATKLPTIKGRFIIKDNDMHEVQGFYYHAGTEKPIHTTPSENIAMLNPLNQPFISDIEHEKEQAEPIKQESDFDFDFS